jgi:UDP-N-acetylmuramoylalanine--D-glutamate ligase
VDINSARVSVVGLGKSGVAVSRLLRNKGASVFASDKAQDIDKEIIATLKNLDIEFELGGHSERCLECKDFIVVSPGVLLNTFPLTEAKKRGIPIYSEIEIGSWFIETPIIAITGTNGKTTTTVLIGELLRAIGKKVIVCGNIGFPLSDAAMENEGNDFIVMEASSFQLETVRDFRPKAGVLLNITPNHLDRYSGDILAYSNAKANLFKNQGPGDFAVLNADDERVKNVPVPASARKIYFSVDTGSPFFSPSELHIPGRHNFSNALASVSTILCLFPDEKRWLKALREFKGLPHRLERVREINGVTFINDSKSTSVDATIKAIQSIPGPIILIAGGRDKESPFELLREAASKSVERIILIGEAKERMSRMLRGAAPIHFASTLEDAVLSAFKFATPGDYVLLSPSCSSFDMFKNFEERGDVFKKIVHSLDGNYKS